MKRCSASCRAFQLEWDASCWCLRLARARDLNVMPVSGLAVPAHDGVREGQPCVFLPVQEALFDVK